MWMTASDPLIGCYLHAKSEDAGNFDSQGGKMKLTVHIRCRWCHAIRPRTESIQAHGHDLCSCHCLRKWEAHNG